MPNTPAVRALRSTPAIRSFFMLASTPRPPASAAFSKASMRARRGPGLGLRVSTSRCIRGWIRRIHSISMSAPVSDRKPWGFGCRTTAVPPLPFPPLSKRGQPPRAATTPTTSRSIPPTSITCSSASTPRGGVAPIQASSKAKTVAAVGPHTPSRARALATPPRFS